MSTDDSSWVFDSLVCFLHGPVWNAPLQTFIEEKSLTFDPNTPLEESNPDYKKIHNEYKNLVDYMLGSFMDEMQITPEQFEIACLEGRNQNQSDGAFSFHQGLFQQIWAANDIRIFIRMMTQRNVELQLQALDLIERRQHSTSIDEDSDNHDEERKTVISKIIEDEEIDEELEKVVENELKLPVGDLKPIAKPLKEVAELEDEEIVKALDSESPKDDRFDRLNLFFQNQASSQEIQSRQEYLRSQRDKILNIKKKARAKQLNESAKRVQDFEMGSSGKSTRPTSAQAAQKVLEGNVDEILPKNTDAMQLRKTLAMRLKSEVVDKK